MKRIVTGTVIARKGKSYSGSVEKSVKFVRNPQATTSPQETRYAAARLPERSCEEDDEVLDVESYKVMYLFVHRG